MARLATPAPGRSPDGLIISSSAQWASLPSIHPMSAPLAVSRPRPPSAVCRPLCRLSVRASPAPPRVNKVWSPIIQYLCIPVILSCVWVALAEESFSTRHQSSLKRSLTQTVTHKSSRTAILYRYLAHRGQAERERGHRSCRNPVAPWAKLLRKFKKSASGPEACVS